MSEAEQKDVQATLASGQKKLESAARSVVSQGTSQNAEATKKILALYQKEIEEASDSVAAEPQNTGKITSSESTSTSTSQTTTTQETQQKKEKEAVNQVGQDIFQPWVGKYDKNAIWLARRIFKSLSENCPQGSLDLIEDLKKLVIKDLS